MKTDKPRVGMAIIVKNEGPYLIEWLAHHRLMGFDHFYVVNNDSSDNTWPLLQALSQTLPITCFSYASTPGIGPQLPVYEEIVRRHGHEVEWMAFMDADEFLWPSHHPDTVSDLLQATSHAHPDVGALALNWATYGSSMKVAEESGLVTERFLHHAPQQHHLNHHFKSIIRMEAFAGFVCPHSCQLKPGYRYLHTDGTEKRDYYSAGQRNPSQSGDVCWARFRINHYVIKSYAEYVHRKASRGRAYPECGPLDDPFFLGHDNNDVRSHPCAQHIVELKARCQDLAGRIGTYGVQFNVGRDYTQGSGSAVRTLVDLATIELIGKWARVPYWQCLTLEQNHPDFQRQLRDWFDEGSPAVRTQIITRSLVSRGYLAPVAQTLPDNDPALRKALARFQADNGMVVTGVVDFATYERALRHFVGLSADGTLARIGWASTHAEPVPHIAASPATPDAAVHAVSTNPGDAKYGDPPPTRSINLQIENVLLERTAFEVGEQVFLSATVSRASYLQCFLADATGTVIRLLPNQANTTGWVSANQAIRIPDWMSPNPGFIMDAASPGTEGVACFATDEDSTPRLPEALRGPPLKPIPNYRALERLNEAFATAWGSEGYTGNAVYWQVVPRRALPAAATAPAQPASRK